MKLWVTKCNTNLFNLVHWRVYGGLYFPHCFGYDPGRRMIYVRVCYREIAIRVWA